MGRLRPGHATPCLAQVSMLHYALPAHGVPSVLPAIFAPLWVQIPGCRPPRGGALTLQLGVAGRKGAVGRAPPPDCLSALGPRRLGGSWQVQLVGAADTCELSPNIPSFASSCRLPFPS